MAGALAVLRHRRWKMDTEDQEAMKKKKISFEEEQQQNVPSSLLSQSLFSVLKTAENCAEEEEEEVAAPQLLQLNTSPNAAAAEETASHVLLLHQQQQRTPHVQDVQIVECCLDVSRECLDFVQTEEDFECLDSLKTVEDEEGVGVLPRRGDGDGGVVVDGAEKLLSHCMQFCESEISCLDSFDAQAGCVDGASEAVAPSESLDSGVAGEEEQLQEDVAKSATTAAAAAGDAAASSGSEISGECSSGGDNKEERSSSSRKQEAGTAGSSKNAAAAAAAIGGAHGGGSGKKKAKVDWTPELHRRFVHAVEQLGVEKAFPSRILELMGVQCLTRHNIASHLQKYRSHRRHLAAREAEAATSWIHHHRRLYSSTHSAAAAAASCWNRSSRRYLAPMHNSCCNSHSPPPIQPRPVQRPHTLLPAHNHQMQQQLLLTAAPLKVWGYPTVDHSSVHLWQQPAPLNPPPSLWQAPDGSYWQHPASSYDAASQSAQAPAAACYPHPMRVPLATMPSNTAALADVLLQDFSSDQDSFFAADEALPDSMYLLCNSYESDDFLGTVSSSAGASCCSSTISGSESQYLSQEILDAAIAISEALANPWTPPPLGLKPPSMEGVIAELQRQGINTVPPSTC